MLSTPARSKPTRSSAMRRRVLAAAIAVAGLRFFGAGDGFAADAPQDEPAFVRPNATFRLASDDSRRSAKGAAGGLTILQIGDSHTAADFFTGEVRRALQARYGSGGPGYVDAGRPHPGVRSAVLSVSATPGWSYSALQKSIEPDDFYLSGFTARAAHGGEVLQHFSGRR